VTAENVKLVLKRSAEMPWSGKRSRGVGSVTNWRLGKLKGAKLRSTQIWTDDDVRMIAMTVTAIDADWTISPQGAQSAQWPLMSAAKSKDCRNASAISSS
jgi:hypothetical protein